MARRWGCIVGLIAVGAAVPVEAREKRPVGLVEAVTNAPRAKVQAFDYLFAGDEVDLRPGGALVLAHFDVCLVDRFQGGRVKVGKQGPEAKGGGKSVRTRRPCQTAALALTDAAREGGVAVKRVSPFEGPRWREMTVPVHHPVFVWPRTKKPVQAAVAVWDVNAEPRRLVWRGTTQSTYLAYPEAAPPLVVGMPYEVVVERRGAAPLVATFSIDPGLDLPRTPLTSAVPLGL